MLVVFPQRTPDPWSHNHETLRQTFAEFHRDSKLHERRQRISAIEESVGAQQENLRVASTR